MFWITDKVSVSCFAQSLMAVFQIPIIGFHQGNKHLKKYSRAGRNVSFFTGRAWQDPIPGFLLIMNPLKLLSIWNSSLWYLVLEGKMVSIFQRRQLDLTYLFKSPWYIQICLKLYSSLQWCMNLAC